MKVIPHLVSTEAGVFRDGEEIDTTGLLAYMEDEDKFVDTMAPDVAYHEAFFAKQLEHANNVVHISISSEMENSAYHAAAEAEKSKDEL